MLIIDLLTRKEEILEIFRKRIKDILEIREGDTIEDMTTDQYSEERMTMTTMMTDGMIAEIMSEMILMKEIEGLMTEEIIIMMIEIGDLLQEDINTIGTGVTDFLFHLNTKQKL